MKKIAREVIQFLERQGFVLVSTIDRQGIPYSSCKGIIEIDKKGLVYLLDLYRGSTYANLKKNPQMSITAVDEHSFRGYCLKGRAKTLTEEGFSPQLIKAWEERLTSRLTTRLLKNIRQEKSQLKHPELLLPSPKYMIVMYVEKIIDLTPRHLRVS